MSLIIHPNLQSIFETFTSGLIRIQFEGGATAVAYFHHWLAQ